mgnify:CR=1 FL=1
MSSPNACTLYIFLNFIYDYEEGLYDIIKRMVRYRFRNKDELQYGVDCWCNPKLNKQTKIKYGHISLWDTSLITNMYKLFYNKQVFNDNINDWVVSNVINMNSMFTLCYKFNQPLDNWDVSRVTNMNDLFSHCDEFNQSLNNWNVKNCIDMNSMFNRCRHFNQPLDKWDVGNVIDMNQMFDGCFNFDQPLGNWDVKKVEYMIGMFNDVKLGIENKNTLNSWFDKLPDNFEYLTKFMNKNDMDSDTESDDSYLGWQEGCASQSSIYDSSSDTSYEED